MIARRDLKSRVATGATQASPGIGHNQPPVEPFGLRARWLRFANDLELRRLAKLEVRIARRKKAIADLTHERQTIMNRCIRRMRRAEGKQ